MTESFDVILELERVHGFKGGWKGIYTLGLRSNPKYLTVRAQQQRASELAKRLTQAWQDNLQNNGEKGAPDEPRIAIIGGGFGGLTLAAHLAEKSLNWTTTGNKPAEHPKRWNISIFERQNQLVPIQRGCYIRKLHPRIHKWPDPTCFDSPGSPSSKGSAEDLSLWQSNSAGAVAAAFVSQVLALHRSEEPDAKKLEIIQSARVLISQQPTTNDTYSLIGEGRRVDVRGPIATPARGTWEFDVIVFATGFGVEVPGADKSTSVSYWRNDDLGQAPLYGQKQRYVISGAGDGALTDLFRLCLYDFSYDRTMKEVLPSQHDEIVASFDRAYARLHLHAEKKDDCPKLVAHYTGILQQLRSNPDVFGVLESGWQRGDITKTKHDGQSLGYLSYAFLIGQCKSDVHVIVQVLPDFAKDHGHDHPIKALVNNPKAMLYNRVLAYLLWRVGAFDARVALSPAEVVVEEKWDPSSVTTIIRRGATWMDSMLSSLGSSLRNQVAERLRGQDSDPMPNAAELQNYLAGD